MCLISRNATPYPAEERIGGTLGDKHGDDRQMSCRIAMHEMHRHFVALAVDCFFARSMKMELSQRVAVASDFESAPARNLHLDGVTIVDDLGTCRGVGESERRQTVGTGLRAFDIDRRLQLASSTKCIV